MFVRRMHATEEYYDTAIAHGIGEDANRISYLTTTWLLLVAFRISIHTLQRLVALL